MEKKKSKHTKKIRNLVLICLLSCMLMTISTYAWFIGMKTVNVSTFDVTIAAIDGLSLSLNGSDWADTVSINSENYSTASYTGNTNSWGGDGLIPMSSVGVIDTTSSRLVLFEKGSLTTTYGGYRLMASQVLNTVSGNTEQDGYVAFDLFIKNLSGNEYYSEDNVLNEEAIYLTTDSSVTVASAGVANTGIENSVRVAFAQIGRVVATTSTVSTITGITCETAGDVTGICRTAQIWEPNDTNHVANAINWYNTSCAKRTGATVTDSASYSSSFGTCSTIADGTAYNTYAVSGVVDYSDNIDVYDGADYNTYTGSTATTPTTGKLMAYDTFTDTEKNMTGTSRPTFITLAPNSITKVRVYVYIEGQDVDNYDFASLGKAITVAFGFTKERYTDEDVDYDDTDTATLPSNLVVSKTTTVGA